MPPAPASNALPLITHLNAANILEQYSGVVQTFAVVGILVLAVIVLAVWLLQRGHRGPIFPYAAKPVLTDAELNFHRTLRDCLPAGTTLCCKVRLADFLEVTEQAGDQRMAHFGRISQKHADFLLVDEETGVPLVVIELDDSTHRSSRRTMESDAFKNEAFAAAGISILRFPAQRQYDSRAIEIAIDQAVADSAALAHP